MVQDCQKYMEQRKLDPTYKAWKISPKCVPHPSYMPSKAYLSQSTYRPKTTHKYIATCTKPRIGQGIAGIRRKPKVALPIPKVIQTPSLPMPMPAPRTVLPFTEPKTQSHGSTIPQP